HLFPPSTLLSLYWSFPLPAPHSFPTRRSSDLLGTARSVAGHAGRGARRRRHRTRRRTRIAGGRDRCDRTDAAYPRRVGGHREGRDRKSTRLNSSHVKISYAVFCLKKKIPHTMQ